MTEYVCNKTEYKKIYENTYWGKFIQEENKGITDEIIENRNKLIRDYKIKKKCTAYTKIEKINKKIKKEWSDYDHLEYYETEKEYILISSPYVEADYEGWEEIYKLYNNGCKSYIKIIEK